MLHFLIRAHLYQKPPPVEEILPSLPKRLSIIIERCIEKEPQHRFKDFGELSSQLLYIYKQVTGKDWTSQKFNENNIDEKIERCIGLSKAGKQQIALIEIDKIIKESKNNCYALFAKGNILKELGEHKAAIRFLEDALKIDDSISSIWFNLGVIYLLEEDKAKGKKCLEKAARNGHSKAIELLESWGDKKVIIFD